MGDVSTTFTADDKQIEKVYEKLKRLDLELIERQRKLHAQTKEGADAFSKWGEEQANFVKGLPAMALGFVGIEKVVDKVSEALTRMRDLQREATKEASAFSLNLARGAGPADAAHLDEINERFEKLQKGGLLTKDQSVGLWNAIGSSAPTLGYGDKMKLYNRTAGFGVFATPELAGGAARLAGAGISSDTAANTAFQIQKLTGGSAGDVMSGETILAARELVNSGAVGSMDEAMAIAVTMARSGKVSAREMDAMARAVGSRERILPKTPEDALKARFLAGTPQQRLKNIFSGSREAWAMMPEQAAKLGAIDWSQRGANLNVLRDDATSDLALSAQGRTAIAAQQAEANQAQGKDNLAREPHDYDAWARSRLGGWWQRLNYELTPGKPRGAMEAASLVGRERGMSREDFESLFTGPGRGEIGGGSYRELLRESRELNPAEWAGAPANPDYSAMLRHLQMIEQNTRPTPQPVVPGRHTDSR